jgi:selenocysteine lyase/cysteine desulfurase
MSNNRRKFLKKAGALTGISFFSSLASPAWARNLDRVLRDAEGVNPADLAGEEDFWNAIRQSFVNTSGMINLNNGGISPAPKIVQEAMKANYDYCNEVPSFFMWRRLDQGREPLRKELARLAGCDAEEIAINRNSSEGLETIIFGLSLKPGDEVVASRLDYPNMINAYKQRELRDKIKMVWIRPDMPSEDDDYLVNQYVNAFTPATKVVHITHVVNWNGQVLPVRRIADEAHKRGIAVVVDGAHSFAHLAFTIPGLGADYFATSLHKWLYAPIGTGLLYVKKEKIKGLYPLFASDDPLKDDIRKFEHLGTRPFYIEQAIGKAVEFYDLIGAERKQQRLYYLKNYWMEKVKSIPGSKLNTSLDPRWACAIGNAAIEGRDSRDMEFYLSRHYLVHTTSINWENIHGVRITPNVYTTIRELDVLVEGINRFVKD